MQEHHRASIIDNEAETILNARNDMNEALGAIEKLDGELRTIHSAHRSFNLTSQIYALGQIEGIVRATGLDLEKELGLIPDVAPDYGRARAERLPDPETVDAQRLAAIEEALKPTGWTESLLEGEAIAVQLPGGLVVTVERPDRAPVIEADAYMPDLDFAEGDGGRSYAFAVNGMNGCGWLIQVGDRWMGDITFSALMGELDAASMDEARETVRQRIRDRTFDSVTMDRLETGWLHGSQKWAGADAS